MNDYIKQNFQKERELYGKKDIILVECSFSGEEDGESALKECENVEALKTTFALRYPFWHCKNVDIKLSDFTTTCRAPLWYCKGVHIIESNLFGLKALRECTKIQLDDCKVVSNEFCWKSKNIAIEKGSVESEYAFFQSKNIKIDDIHFFGKYSFQYCKNVKIENSVLNTKDAFWHSKDIVLINCVVNGEYLGWYSENLTLINCKITGTQPLCYCKNVRIINCSMEDCDLAFEYSSVRANIIGKIKSIKNPKSGKILADYIGEIIITDDSKVKSNAIVLKK